jgi:uncharacterized surface protein with fasciclin (FAS1) repeats
MKINRTLALLTMASIAMFGVACSDDDSPSNFLQAQPNIVEVAQSAGSFETLLTAATTAGLADTLANDGPYTVFAPNDAAFAKLAPGTVEDLLKPENRDTLTAILLYHVVPGEFPASAIAAETMLPTATPGGEMLTVSVDGDDVRVDDSLVVTPNVDASNGIIHIIDTVLIPGS